jgi:UDP-N-acetylglucosamine 3-dehydrogenase
MVGIGLIGTGYWGKNHARVYRELLAEGLIDDLVFCDVDKSRVKDLAGDDIRYTTDYRELLTDGTIDAVDIVTPSKTHMSIGSEFLKCGKDVFVEKPMTTSSEEAEEFVRIAEESGRVLMVGHIFRYHPGINEIKNKINKNEFGKIYYMDTKRTAFSSPRRDMGVLYALGIHDVDLYCHLLGQDYPEKIECTRGKYLQSDIEEIAHLDLFFKGGILCHAFESWMSPFSRKTREFTIIGSKMSAKIDYLKPQEVLVFQGSIDTFSDVNKSISFDITDEGVTTKSIPFREPLKEELIDFLECVKTGKTPVADMYSGKRAVEMIESCMRN